jgi:hypothetical protein
LGLKVNFDPLILITGILPLVITVIGAFFFLIFASSTPKSLLENNHDSSAFKGKNKIFQNFYKLLKLKCFSIKRT